MITKKSILFLLLTTSILFQIASAFVGVTPVTYEVNFEPGLKQVFSFRFMGDPDTQFKVYAAGDLAEYIALSTEYLKQPGTVNALLELPNEIAIPGAHRIYIGAAQQPKDVRGFGIVGDIRGKIIVYVPYPGKYIEAELITQDIRYGDIGEFSLKVSNKGEEDVSADSYIYIYDPEGGLVEQIPLGENYLKSQEKIELYAEFDSVGHQAGSYKAVGVVKYDIKEAKSENTFRIGELFVDITGWSRKFWRGRINPLNIEVESRWNDPIENLYADIFILNHDIRFHTPSITLKGFEKANLTGYFDTTPIPVDLKEVQARITLYYGDKKTEKVVTLKLIKEIDYMMYGLVASILVLIILLVIVMIITRKMYGIKKQRKKSRR